MGSFLRLIERFMGMNDRVWRRHANPWSGFTRFTVLPLLILAIWSRVWIGAWAWALVALVLFWNWLNPRLLAEPKSWGQWMSRGVLGERIYIDHHATIPKHHRKAGKWLAWASLPGVLIMAWGLYALWWEGAVLGALLGVIPKIWFLDRMVWLHDDWVREGGQVPGMEDRDA